MKNLLAGILKYHLLPILMAGMLTCLAFFIYTRFKPAPTDPHVHIVAGQQTAVRGTFANFPNEKTEIELAGSLASVNTIKVFGSSEMGEVLHYSPYYFLPDSAGMQVVGFGHAFHQDFSMFCELLAMKKYLKGSKICIVLSPGWFETEGTNTEAFLEFARPNFLKSIIYNNDIPLKYKLEIGRFIAEHYDDIDQPGAYLEYFKNLYQTHRIPLLGKELEENKAGITKVVYDVKPVAVNLKSAGNIDWNATEKRIQQAFVKAITTNQLFVNDTYFNNILKQEGGNPKGKTDEIVPPAKNREFKDFLLLVELLKQNGCDATFIIQPLNPHYYEGLENYSETISAIEKVLQKNEFPYLNLFTADKRKYEPGTLDDVMHLGDYGWMKVNRFLYENYR